MFGIFLHAGAALVAVHNLSLEKLFFVFENILPKLELNILVMVRIFNIAATPKGVANYVIPFMLRGEEARFAHLIPSLCFRNPQGGSLLSPHSVSRRLAMIPDPQRGFPAFLAFRSNSIFVVM